MPSLNKQNRVLQMFNDLDQEDKIDVLSKALTSLDPRLQMFMVARFNDAFTGTRIFELLESITQQHQAELLCQKAADNVSQWLQMYDHALLTDASVRDVTLRLVVPHLQECEKILDQLLQQSPVLDSPNYPDLLRQLRDVEIPLRLEAEAMRIDGRRIENEWIDKILLRYDGVDMAEVVQAWLEHRRGPKGYHVDLITGTAHRIKQDNSDLEWSRVTVKTYWAIQALPPDTKGRQRALKQLEHFGSSWWSDTSSEKAQEALRYATDYVSRTTRDRFPEFYSRLTPDS